MSNEYITKYIYIYKKIYVLYGGLELGRLSRGAHSSHGEDFPR
jgi:hypothetical protein